MGDTETKKTHAQKEQAHWKKKGMIAILVLFFIGVVLFLWYRYSTYTRMVVVKTYGDNHSAEGNYIRYADGVLHYSRDGIEMLTENGEEVWNQPYQMSNPVVEICDEAVAVGNRGGSTIMVFEKKGLKGEISTNRPIEKFAVSSQGIVTAILQDTDTPRVVCYDAKGNVLADHKASLMNTGYPMDVAISKDGNTLLVSYLNTTDGAISTRIVYYNFGKAGANQENHMVGEKIYADKIIPVTAFLDKKTSIMISDKSLIIYKGVDVPKEQKEIVFETEIKSVAYDSSYIAILLENAEKTGYELKLFHKNGKLAFSKAVKEPYASMCIKDKQVMLFEGERCTIYNSAGVCKFKGTIEIKIEEMFPVKGWNKYLVISATGFHAVQLK